MNEKAKILNLKKRAREWLADYEKITGTCYGDDETLEGSAYILLSAVLVALDDTEQEGTALENWKTMKDKNNL